MTKPKPKPTEPGTLAPFEGHDVITSRVAITNAGDGLSAAMSVDPVELHHGQKVYIVMETEVAKVWFEAVKDTGKMARVHTLRAGAATIVDEDIVREHLAKQRRRILEACGVTELPWAEGNGEEPTDGEPDADAQ